MATPDEIYAKSYGSIVAPLAQQEGSRIRNRVMVKTGVNAEETYMDQMTAFEVKTKGARLSKTNPEAIDVARRRIALEDKYIAKGIDKSDDIRTLADPTSAVVQSGIWGMGREIDQVIYDAARGTAFTGKVGGTPVVLPAGQKVPVAASNMTLDKWLSGIDILNGNDYTEQDRVLVIGSSQLKSLLNTTEIKSADYNAIKALVNGQINTFLGCDVVRLSNDIIAKEGDNRMCLLFAKKAMGLAVGQDVTSRITEESTLHFAKQLYFSMSMGASRLEEDGVVEIPCDETV